MLRGSFVALALVVPFYAFGAGDGQVGNGEELKLSQRATTEALRSLTLKERQMATGDDLSQGYTDRKLRQGLRYSAADAEDSAGTLVDPEATQTSEGYLPAWLLRWMRWQ